MSVETGRLYDLGMRVMEAAQSDEMQRRRNDWRAHNSFGGQRPLLYLRAFAFEEFFDESTLTCEDPFLRRYERLLHQYLYRWNLHDDTILEPWVMIESVYAVPDEKNGASLSVSAKSPS